MRLFQECLPNYPSVRRVIIYIYLKVKSHPKVLCSKAIASQPSTDVALSVRANRKAPYLTSIEEWVHAGALPKVRLRDPWCFAAEGEVYHPSNERSCCSDQFTLMSCTGKDDGGNPYRKRKSYSVVALFLGLVT